MTDFQKKVYPVRKNIRNLRKKEKLEFSNGVYQIVKKIPRGKVMTYKEVAEAIDKPRAYRAVGNALNKNINPKVSCHRVIRSNGKIGGYKLGPQKKMNLLKKEGLKIVKLKIQ